jgi:alcohol dehydrogenase class IV
MLSLGLPRSLKEVGVGRVKIEALAKRTLDDAWAGMNPIALAKSEQVAEILEMWLLVDKQGRRWLSAS